MIVIGAIAKHVDHNTLVLGDLRLQTAVGSHDTIDDCLDVLDFLGPVW